MEPVPSVEGRIIVAGRGPLTGGTIQFVSAAGRIGAGMIRADGTYRVAEAPVGECKVVVNNQNLARAGGKFLTPTETMGKGLKGEGGIIPGVTIPAQMKNKNAEEGVYMAIEDQFAAMETTPLRATLGKGANTVDFEVK